MELGRTDEADSLLIDEARVPLVIAESLDRPVGRSYRMAEIARRLEPRIHYEMDEYGRAVDLTEAGLARELEIDYACLALSVNWAAGIDTDDITMEAIMAILEQGVDRLRPLLLAAARLIET